MMDRADVKSQMTKQLAEALHQAATTPAEGWELVASRLIAMMEEIAREAVAVAKREGEVRSP